MRKTDLHIHTTASDGMLKPTEVVDWAVHKELIAIAITDHDTTKGIREALERSKFHKNIEVVPGIELSSDYQGEEVHILGYFIDYHNEELLNATKVLRQSRLVRGEKMVHKLREMGINISLNEVKELADAGFIGRPHIARVLFEKGYVEGVADAFDKYIGKDKPAYVNRYKLSLKESIDLIHKAGGVAVLAHPGIIAERDVIKSVVDMGIDGIEVIHSSHGDEIIERLLELAKNYNLICTGGSDCHGHFIEDDLLLGEYTVDYEIVERLKELSKLKYQG